MIPSNDHCTSVSQTHPYCFNTPLRVLHNILYIESNFLESMHIYFHCEWHVLQGSFWGCRRRLKQSPFTRMIFCEITEGLFRNSFSRFRFNLTVQPDWKRINKILVSKRVEDIVRRLIFQSKLIRPHIWVICQSVQLFLTLYANSVRFIVHKVLLKSSVLSHEVLVDQVYAGRINIQITMDTKYRATKHNV